MEKENWINVAFDEAFNDAEKLEKLSEKLRNFLDECTPGILDRWSNIVGFEKAVRFAKMISDSDENIELIDHLTFCFTAAGYLLAKSEEKE